MNDRPGQGGELDLLAEIDALPEEERAHIQARAEDLNRQVQALKQLRQYADKSQQDVAQALGIKQPSVSKIEAQTDMYLSTLRDYIEALGGSMKLVVNLPDYGTIELDDLADLSNRQRGDVDPTKPETGQVGDVEFYRSGNAGLLAKARQVRSGKLKPQKKPARGARTPKTVKGPTKP